MKTTPHYSSDGISRRTWLGGVAGLGGSAAMAQPASAGRPNFLLIVADDLGFGDLHCFGSQTVRSPNIDRFAAAGLRFTDCYSGAPLCSPARAALMTGRTPTRAGIHTAIPTLSPMHLHQEEVTIATILRKAGYATSHVGKWHLNGEFNSPSQPQPGDHGFDHWFSTQNVALPNHHNPYNFVRNGVPMGPQVGYSGEIVAREAIRWLKEVRAKDKPFFQYVCFHEPHEPIATDKRFVDLYPSKDPSYSDYYGNITQLDDAVGRLLAAIDELGLRENTLIFLTSDNGPARTAMHPHGSAGPYRGQKLHVYEGGIRLPGIVSWPGKIKAGVSDEPVSGVDWLPTVCDITGLPKPRHRAIDGSSWLPLFNGRTLARETPLYWQYNAAPSKPKVAMRVGEWKILAHLTGPELKLVSDISWDDQQALKRAELDRFELYHLREDPGEKEDRAAAEPARLKQMAGVLGDLYYEVRDESPMWPGWKAPGYERDRIEWPDYWRNKNRKPPAP